MRALISQLARFGVVGLVGLVVDVGIFNLLHVTILNPGAVHNGPLWAKVISTSVAIIVNWLGNRYWTFRHERRAHWIREAVEFALVSLGGLLIAVGCLWFSEYVLGLRSLLADNIATNVVGLVLGTLFRFVFYRFWVYNPSRAGSRAPTSSRSIEPATLGSTPMGSVPAGSATPIGVPASE
jgi:putative flippase GtrA